MFATQLFERGRIGRCATVAGLHFPLCGEPVITATPFPSPPIHISSYSFGSGFTTIVKFCSWVTIRTSLMLVFCDDVCRFARGLRWDSNPHTTVLAAAELDVGQHGPHYIYRYLQVERRECTYRNLYTDTREPVL